jgi:hypothetical protein
MSTYRVAVTQEVDAPPEKVYPIFSDYVTHHPKILPKPYFDKVEVEQGGYGAGTVIRVTMKAWGSTVIYRFTVTEPEPGRLLAEEDPEAGVRTTFLVEPLDGGKRSAVTLATENRQKPGLRGWIERLLTPMLMQPIYRQEIANVNEYVKGMA